MTTPRNLRALVAVGGALVAVLVASCTTEDEPSTSASNDTASTMAPVTSNEPEPVASDDVGEVIFITALDADRILLDVPEGERIEIGYQVCEDFDSGVTYFDLVARNPMFSERPYDVGFLVGAAVTAFCPEHTGEIPG